MGCAFEGFEAPEALMSAPCPWRTACTSPENTAEMHELSTRSVPALVDINRGMLITAGKQYSLRVPILQKRKQQ